MKSNFDRCLPLVLAHEGGWADHPSDPGGATMKGITIGTYAQWKGRKVTKAELRAIPDSEVAAIYRRKYWDVVRGDDLPAGLDYVAFDAAVNSGPGRAARWVQAAIGAPVDGKIGDVTVRLAKQAQPLAAIHAAMDIRLKFLRSLKTWPTFGKGWQRRIDDVRRDASRMIASATLTRPAPHVNEMPKREHDRLRKAVAQLDAKPARTQAVQDHVQQKPSDVVQNVQKPNWLATLIAAIAALFKVRK